MPVRIPSQWRDFCKQSKSWCNGFHAALLRAKAKSADPAVNHIISAIDGFKHPKPGKLKPEKDDDRDAPAYVAKKHEEASGLLVAGIVIAILLMVAAAIGLFFYLRRKKLSKKSNRKKSVSKVSSNKKASTLKRKTTLGGQKRARAKSGKRSIVATGKTKKTYSHRSPTTKPKEGTVKSAWLTKLPVD